MAAAGLSGTPGQENNQVQKLISQIMVTYQPRHFYTLMNLQQPQWSD